MDVYATDADKGKNGDIRYVLVPHGAEIDVTAYLVMDSMSGHVTLLSPISRSLLSSDTLLVWVKAIDGGVPPKEAKAQLHIEVLDENDHCPVFHSPDPGSIHYVNMSMNVDTTVIIVKVSDDDFGENSEVALRFGANTDNVVQDTFNVDSTNGRISSLVSPLTVGTFHVVIVATDGATSPCSKQMSITIQVLPPDVEPPVRSTTPAPLATNLTVEPPTTGEQETNQPVTSTLAAQTTSQQNDADSVTNDSSRSIFVILGSVFAFVVLLAVLIIAIQRSQVVDMKAHVNDKPASIQPRWHTHFNDSFHAQRE